MFDVALGVEVSLKLFIGDLDCFTRLVLVDENITRPALFGSDLEIVLVSVEVRAEVGLADLNLVAKLLRIYFGPSDVVAGVAFLIIFLGRFRIDFNGRGDEAAQMFLSDRRAEILLEYIRSHSTLLQSHSVRFSAGPRGENLPQA